jgi:hypothetical protein
MPAYVLIVILASHRHVICLNYISLCMCVRVGEERNNLIHFCRDREHLNYFQDKNMSNGLSHRR